MLALFRIQDADVAEIPVELLVIEPEADHEAIGYFKAPEIDGHLHDAARGAVEHDAQTERSRAAAGERLEQVARRESGIDDVLDQQNVFILDGMIEIFFN